MSSPAPTPAPESSPDRPAGTTTQRRRIPGVAWAVIAVIVGLLALVLAAQFLEGDDALADTAVETTDSGETAATPEGTTSDAEDGAAATAAEGPREGELPIVRRDADDPMAIGSVDAPVVLVEWIDYRCPFCAVYSTEILPTIEDEYVASGQVRIEINDVSFFGDESEDAAVAARAAGEQGKYLEYMTVVFDNAPSSGHPDMPAEKLIAFAEDAGVPDIEQFTADLDREDLHAAVQESTATAQQLGVSAVPFFAIGTESISGAQPVDVFRQFIDARLPEAS
ncbi:Protein-disulfide isomerase [Paraoerskovia marina]|uniref:Protein-disulfide isomerase n=1 Tax=Paraoerskovia marina TaxID=545619 RepID=A0A1H1NRY2_9CELL|nr:thioredoxin domain-containing protein [Paraoerskovia marina]SDS01550.1 Protein-disulfide isomerase [Paraoerskovia marina]